MRPAAHFRHCPRCAAPLATADANPLACPGCGFCYFFNPTVAAAAFVFDADGRCLFLVRAHDPAKGKLAVPGGFVDAGETAEDAVRRETREEVGLELTDVRFLGSCPNEYFYREVTYPVCDLVFTATAVAPHEAQPLDAVEALVWRRPAEVAADELAFPSLRMGLRRLAGG